MKILMYIFSIMDAIDTVGGKIILISLKFVMINQVYVIRMYKYINLKKIKPILFISICIRIIIMMNLLEN